MIIGIPKEIKEEEFRVGVVPAGVKSFVQAGHSVIIETKAGIGSGISDKNFVSAGAEIVNTPAEVFSKSDLIIKVKEPYPSEYDFFKKGQVLYTFLHLAPAKKLTKSLLSKKIIAIAYETIQLEDGSLPLLKPMSEIAGKISIQEGAKYLGRNYNGRGILLGGVSGVEKGDVVIIGAGAAGINAVKIALGMGAAVTILDINLEKLRYVDDIFDCRVNTLISNSHNIAEAVVKADLVVGTVLVPGDRTPCLVTTEMVNNMKKGSVIVDVCIDQGGCIETSKPTSHSNPVFSVNGVTHYCVTNIPSIVSRTSTFALTNVTFPYALEIANKGYEKAVRENGAILRGVNLAFGKVTHKAIADSLKLKYYNFFDIF